MQHRQLFERQGGAESTRELTVRQAPDDVFVIAGVDIVPWLSHYPRIFPPDVVATTYEKARISTTWLT